MRLTCLLLALVVMAGCTSQPVASDTSESTTASASTLPPAGEIVAEITFPTGGSTLLGDVSGRVVSVDDAVVAEFEFESGWIVPEDWDFREPVDKSGAATTVSVTLPRPDRYTFWIDAYVLSGQPCGTCESGFSATSVTVDVVDGSTVRMPPGEPDWQS